MASGPSVFELNVRMYYGDACLVVYLDLMYALFMFDGLPVNEPMSAASWETSQWLGQLLCEVYLRIKRTCNICTMVVYLSK